MGRYTKKFYNCKENVCYSFNNGIELMQNADVHRGTANAERKRQMAKKVKVSELVQQFQLEVVSGSPRTEKNHYRR